MRASGPRRADAVRNREAVLDAAARAFAADGVDVPVRTIAGLAGVGVGTLYRHFPTRADLIVATYEHQVRACSVHGRDLLAEGGDPVRALRAWIDVFVDFLATKHGLAVVLGGESAPARDLAALLLDELVPVCSELLAVARADQRVRDDLSAFELLRAVGNLCVGAADERYDPRRLVDVLLTGLERPPPRVRGPASSLRPIRDPAPDPARDPVHDRVPR